MQLGLRKLVGVDINPEDIRKIARRMGPLYGTTPSAGKQKKLRRQGRLGCRLWAFSFYIFTECTAATADSWQGLGRKHLSVMLGCSAGSAVLRAGAADAGPGGLSFCCLAPP